MNCEGDKQAGFDSTQVCYREEACPGCEKCIIKCEGCTNCKEMEVYQELRKPEVGDFVTVHQKLIVDPNFKHSWQPAMDDAVGRVGWVKSGNPVDGFKIKFTTTESDRLNEFVFPQSSLKLASKDDRRTDTFIKQTKDSSEDPNLHV